MRTMNRREALLGLLTLPALSVLGGCAFFSTGPFTDFHVSANGSDDGGDGSPERPWRQIGHALQTIPAAVTNARILVGAGDYAGGLRIRREIVIQGAGPEQVRLRAPAPSEPVVEIQGPGLSARLEGVLLDGQNNRNPGLVARNAGLRLVGVHVLQPLLSGISLEDCALFSLEACRVSTGDIYPVWTDLGLNLVRSQGSVIGFEGGDLIDHVINIIGGAVVIDGAQITGSPIWYADGIRIQSAADVTVRRSSIVRPPGGEVPPDGRAHNPPYAGVEVAAPWHQGRQVVLEDLQIAGFDVGVGVNLEGNAIRLRRVSVDSARESCVRVIHPVGERAPVVDLGRVGDPGGNRFGPDAPYALYHQAAFDVRAHGNDWGVAAADVERRIHDRLDDPRLGRVLR